MPRKKKEKMETNKMVEEMVKILKRLDLSVLNEKFKTERISPDIVGKLSLADFDHLDLRNKAKIMALRSSMFSLY